MSEKIKECETSDAVAVPQSLATFERTVKDKIVFNDNTNLYTNEPNEEPEEVENKWMQCLEFCEKEEGELLDDNSDLLYDDINEDYQWDVVDENDDIAVEYDEVCTDELMHEECISSIFEDYGLEKYVFRDVNWEEIKIEKRY